MATLDRDTIQITSLEVATEATYGSAATATGVPAVGALVFAGAEITERTSVTPTGEPAMIESMATRTGLYDLPAEPATVDGVHRSTAKFTIEMPIRTIGAALAAGGGSAGTAFDDYADMPMWELANTGLQASIHPTRVIDDVTGDQTVNRFEGTSIANYETGLMFKTVINGRSEFSGVTSLVAIGDEVWHSPALSTAIDTPAQVLPMSQLIVPASGVPDTISTVVRFNGIGWKGIGYGCTADAIKWLYDEEKKRLRLAVDLDSPFMTLERTAVSEVVDQDLAAGHHQFHMQAYCVISGDTTTYATGATAPAEFDRATYCLDAMECVTTITREAAGCGEDVVAQGARPITDISTTMTLTISGTTDEFDDDLWLQQMRSVLVGFTSGDPEAQGECSCLYMPAAVLQNDPLLMDAGKGFWRTTLIYKAGPWSGDLDPGAQGDPNDSHFRWAVGEAYDPA